MLGRIAYQVSGAELAIFQESVSPGRLESTQAASAASTRKVFVNYRRYNAEQSRSPSTDRYGVETGRCR